MKGEVNLSLMPMATCSVLIPFLLWFPSSITHISSHFPSPFTQESILTYLHCHPHHSPTTFPPYYPYPESSHPYLCLISSTPQLNSPANPSLSSQTSCLHILIASSQFPIVIASMISILPLLPFYYLAVNMQSPSPSLAHSLLPYLICLSILGKKHSFVLCIG